MSTSMPACDRDEALLALAHERLAGPARAELEVHVACCAACAEELAWARAEIMLAARRAKAMPPPPDAVGQAVAARTKARAAGLADRRRGATLGAALLVAAAAAVAVWRADDRGPRPPAPVATVLLPASAPAPSGAADADAQAAFAGAAAEYEAAIAQLERDWASRRRRIAAPRAAAIDAALVSHRQSVDVARVDASHDPRRGQRMLRAYRGYLRTLRSATSLEEA